VVLATRNPGKIREVRRLLAPAGLSLAGLDAFSNVQEGEETGATFLENALLKARSAARATGLPAVADDSGLEVEALGGAPGVHSARYAGEPRSDAGNNTKLMRALERVPRGERGAAFRCVAAAALPGGEAIWAEGVWRGVVLEAPRGEGGFGYDPLFLDPEAGRTAAEMPPGEKDARSHRGKAFRDLAARLPALLAWAQANGSGGPGRGGR
jgi:XTP/dITP diphosphohydrolase